jgi:hypothetical protein
LLPINNVLLLLETGCASVPAIQVGQVAFSAITGDADPIWQGTHPLPLIEKNPASQGWQVPAPVGAAPGLQTQVELSKLGVL